MTDAPKPTAQVAPFVETFGHDLAVDFLLEFGGAPLQLSRKPGTKSQLVQLVGRDAAKALTDLLGAGRIDVPSAKPWLSHALKSNDLSTYEIARTLHTSAVTVRKWLRVPQAEWAGNPKVQPLPLFPDLD
jgi:hypothetical protein